MARLTLKDNKIKLWVATDEAGFIMVFRNKPTRINDGSTVWGDWKGDLLEVLSPTELKKYTNQIPTWEDEPIMIEV